MYIVAVGVLAGAYPRGFKWNEARCLTHAVEIDAHGEFIRVLCGGPKLAHMSDDDTMFYWRPVNCPRCLSKLKQA